MNIPLQIAAYQSLTTITLFFTLGITAGYYWPLSPFGITIAASILLIFLIAAFFLCWQKPFPLTKRLFSLIFVPFFLGVLHISSAIQLPENKEHLYYQFEKKREAVLGGFLQSMPVYNGKTTTAIIESSWIQFPEKQYFTRTKGKILLRMKGTWPTTILPGDSLIARADIKRPQSYQTPGVFDYSRFLAEKDIWVTGFIRSPLLLHKITAPQQGFPRTFFERFRTKIAYALNKQLTPQHAGLYKAILLGDRSGIPPPLLENFKACGVLHLLAISGLHVSVIWSLFYFFWYWLFSRSEYILLNTPAHLLAALFTLPFILVYAFLAGLQTPVLRATIMSTVLVIALLRRQHTTPPPLLSGAALLLLLIQPMQLFTPSFQLSFLAVAAIFFLLPLLQTITASPQSRHKKDSFIHRGVQKLWRWIIAALLLSCGISLITAPITAFHFHRLSLIGAFANLLLEPLLCLWILPWGIISIPFFFIKGNIAALLITSGTAGLQLATDVLTSAARLPFSFSWMTTARPFFLWGMILFYSGIFLLIVCKEKIADVNEEKMNTFKKRTYYSGIAMIALAIPLFFHSPTPENRITFIDVGQGSATLIEYNNGISILVDGGGSSFSSTSVGQRVIFPYLLSEGKKNLDAIILTHPDADHSNGLNYILENFPVKTLWVRSIEEKSLLHKKLLNTARQKETLVTVPKRKEALFSQPNASFLCFHNFGSPKRESSIEKNRGLVLLAQIAGWNLLLPGDIDKDAERKLLTEHIPQSEIFLASHHGSKTSNAKVFIEALDPQIVITSAGQKEGTFPSTALINYLRRKRIPLLTTAKHGTIEITLKEKEIKIRLYKKETENPLSPYCYREIFSKRREKLALPSPLPHLLAGGLRNNNDLP